MVTNIEALSAWCQAHLHSAIDSIIFEAGFTSRVLGLRLWDGTEVIVKLRPFTRRLLGAAEVTRGCGEADFHVRRVVPLAHFGSTWISAETLVQGGQVLTDDPAAPELYAAAVADMVARAPAVEDVPDLLPPPARFHWNHSEAGPWPRPEVQQVDVNQLASPSWLLHAAARARHRLSQCSEAPVIGHADWWSENLRWNGHQLHVLFDWDSITAQPELVVVGAAVYMFAATTFEIEGSAHAADVSQSERFLVAYAHARGRAWSREQGETAWAASVWVAAYQVQLSALESVTGGFAELVRRELAQRWQRAGV